MKVEIVIIGSELLLGQSVDTNATFMAQALAEHGIDIHQKTTVGDNQERIVQALAAALDRADAVLTSGGLGPTEDDLTREAVADLLERPLEFREDLYRQLCARFASMKRPMTENNKKQACMPRGAVALENPNGTAPGLIVEDERGTVVCMPGVPSELRAMLTERVIPFLRDKFGLHGLLHSRTLKVCGLGESRVDEAIGDLIQNQKNPTIGLLASPDAVRIRITAKADRPQDAEALIDPIDAQIRARLPGLVMGVDDDTLEGVVDAMIAERGWKLAVAETNTGGMIAQRLTAAGAKTFVGGIVLPVRPLQHNDPEEAAREVAEEARKRLETDCALGLVYDSRERRTEAAFLTPQGSCDWTVGYPGTDERSQLRVSVVSLEHVRRFLADLPADKP